MKTSFGSFWRRNLALVKLAIQTNIEYRVNFATDVIVQPVLTSIIEFALWTALFRSISAEGGPAQIGGLTLNYYLSYALWAAFISRITTNWMYEHLMIQEIEKGTVNAILLRPITFFEFYLSQYLGYKFITTAFSIPILVVLQLILDLPFDGTRIPLALALVFYYLAFTHVISMFISSFAFFFNRVYSLTGAKNLLLWLLTGELFPLDLIPPPYREWFILSPFSSGVYLPVGYITGRVNLAQMQNGFLSVTTALVVLGSLTALTWNSGLRKYSGSGA